MLNICINGAEGRMGQTLALLVADAPDMGLVGLLERPDSDAIGNVVADCTVSADARSGLTGAQAVIDFSVPTATAALAKIAGDMGVAMVVGTTGLGAEHEAILRDTARKIPVVYSGNYSLGVNVLATLVQRAAAALPPELFDLEVFESHHGAKVDAPSGTALLLGRAGAAGRGQVLDDIMVPARHGHTGARPQGAIGFSVVRGGDVTGDHTVFFLGTQERLELTHRATNRMIFARGALHAARWAATQPPGLYDMQDVLGLK